MLAAVLLMLLKKRELAAVVVEVVGIGLRGRVAQCVLELWRGVIFTLLGGVAPEAVEVGVGEVLAPDEHVVAVAAC